MYFCRKKSINIFFFHSAFKFIVSFIVFYNRSAFKMFSDKFLNLDNCKFLRLPNRCYLKLLFILCFILKTKQTAEHWHPLSGVLVKGTTLLTSFTESSGITRCTCTVEETDVVTASGAIHARVTRTLVDLWKECKDTFINRYDVGIN